MFLDCIPKVEEWEVTLEEKHLYSLIYAKEMDFLGLASVEGVISNFSLRSLFSPTKEEVHFGMDMCLVPNVPMNFSMGCRFKPTKIEDLFCIGPMLPIEEKRVFWMEKKAFQFLKEQRVDFILDAKNHMWLKILGALFLSGGWI